VVLLVGWWWWRLMQQEQQQQEWEQWEVMEEGIGRLGEILPRS
jgi:hypothetical protein